MNVRRGLTDLFFVIAFGFVLVGIFLPNPINSGGRGAMRKATTLQIRSIVEALELYAADHQGQVPTTETGLSPLIEQPPEDSNRKGPYFKNSLTVPIDPWGSPILYEAVPVDRGRTRIRVWSLGPDKQSATTDDIASERVIRRD